LYPLLDHRRELIINA
jgi:nitric oxide reductase NorQ protein